MVYTVGEMAKLLDIPASTLRYYDKEGLLPFVERSSGGIRLFRESDFEWLRRRSSGVLLTPMPMTATVLCRSEVRYSCKVIRQSLLKQQMS